VSNGCATNRRIFLSTYALPVLLLPANGSSRQRRPSPLKLLVCVEAGAAVRMVLVRKF